MGYKAGRTKTNRLVNIVKHRKKLEKEEDSKEEEEVVIING